MLRDALSRRRFFELSACGLAANALTARAAGAHPADAARPDQTDTETRAPAALGDGVQLDSLLTPQDRFYDVSRGEPLPHSLPEEQRRSVGLTRDTWQLEVVSDPEHPVRLRKPLTKEKGTALNFAGLLALGENHAVRFVKVMTCLNLGCPLGMGLWEGVPLREVVWQTEPEDNLRRVFYYGYHNDDPAQMFKSSLPAGRVFEDPFDLPPVILCYKLNGQWLSPERGGPVRVVVPEHYGYKSIKWLSHVVLTNLSAANDTYAEQGNDIDSPLKTFAATIGAPRTIAAGQPIPLAGYAQVGIGGLSKVQAWIEPEGAKRPEGERYSSGGPWVDMLILPPPDHWGAELPNGHLPMPVHGFDPATSRPKSWPLRLGLVHWKGELPGLPAGKYTLRCRAIDAQGHAQPLPRPFRKSGYAAIEQVGIEVK
jgi:DMSO/TMAO reductase YedYZ molybdopterin-dependent catalytic subunit